jgi:molecular chaperone HtpG
MSAQANGIPFFVEINRIIELLAKQIYQSPLALLRENCQNAYDAILQRLYLRHDFHPRITVKVDPTQISVSDNGIGMTRDELIRHYWRAGASGKNNPEARAAGVVGTFGIGAMANFGIASELTVISESATTAERTRCHAIREKLSATENCIDLVSEAVTGNPGTTVIARVPEGSPINVASAVEYLHDCVRYLEVPVSVNDKTVSNEDFESTVPKPSEAQSFQFVQVKIGPQITADMQLAATRTGEVWLHLTNISFSSSAIVGSLILRQNLHQISTYRSRFALASTAVSSHYGFGGVANLSVLEPTAGREALTTSSLQLLQSIVSEVEKFVSEQIANTEHSNQNTGFMEWASIHSRYDLCSRLMIRLEPDSGSTALQDVRSKSQHTPFNYYQGSDDTIIAEYATEESPLIVVSTRQPRRRCELAYLQQYCRVVQVSDSPQVISRMPERDWSLSQSALALRLISILEVDYFVPARVDFGKLTHKVTVLVDVSKRPVDIVLDAGGSTIATIMKLYDTDYGSMTSMVKDFVRSVIFPRISHLVPSSTKQGAEAFLKAIRRPRELFEYEKSDLGSFAEIWQDYMDGKISLADAARQSTTIVRTSVQVFERAGTTRAADVIPDVLENEKLIAQAESEGDVEEQPLPAITRLEKQSSAKLLIIDDDEPALKGYRCFVALTERVRNTRGEFFLQPHRTEIVWGGQKALYIFQHHSGEFGLYYELQSNEVFAEVPGGRVFPTCTIILKNQVYIPVPDELRAHFIPQNGKKQFEIRCELLYPDTSPVAP